MPDNESDESQNKSLLERITEKLFHALPETKEDLVESIKEAHKKKVVNDDALHMIEGVLQIANLRAGDLMVPRAQMKVLDISEKRKAWVKQILEEGHSRYPVVDGDKDNVIGVVLVKDLLHLVTDDDYDIRDHIRDVQCVPESKPVDILLREFQSRRNHLALVVDEFGSISGLITLEDVIEEIVGEIDDEYDVNRAASDIVLIHPGRWQVKATTTIREFNEFFGTDFSAEHYGTVGGLVSDELEHVPVKGETLERKGFRFKVRKASERHVQMFYVEEVTSKESV